MTPKPTRDTKKLSFNQQRELDQLPGIIEQLEADIADLHYAMSQTDYYQQPGDQIAADAAKLKTLEQKLQESYFRWEELEAM